MRTKERKKNTPARMMENFLPIQLREREDRLLPSMAPSGGRDTVWVRVITCIYTVSRLGLPIHEQVSASRGAVASTSGLVLLLESFRLGRPVEAQALTRPMHR